MDRLAVGVALLARAAAAPPQKGQVLSPTVSRRLSECRNVHACLYDSCPDHLVHRMTPTASLWASHSSPGLPPRQRRPQRVRCCLRMFCCRLSECRNCMHACMVMPVMLDRMSWTASLSCSHSSPGLPPRKRPRQRARCLSLSVCQCL